MLNEVYDEAKQLMGAAVDAFQRELSGIRTGRANTSLLDSIKVEYYGSYMPLTQVANLNAPEATLITIQPYDVSQLAAIEKAIRESNLGLNPQNDGKIIRLPLPPLTEERRKDLVKVMKEYAESARVAVRNARKDANQTLKDMEKEKELTEDDLRQGQDTVQKLTDDHVKKIDDMLKVKEEEVMKV